MLVTAGFTQITDNKLRKFFNVKQSLRHLQLFLQFFWQIFFGYRLYHRKDKTCKKNM